jgi:hypothetical protein
MRSKSLRDDPVLITSDDWPEVVDTANIHGFQIERISMKNTHHEKKYELLISNFGRPA